MPHGKKTIRQSGFTLIELLVVLVIIGLLAALVAPTIYQRIAPAKETAARAQMQTFMTALDNYFLDVGSYPGSHEGLRSLVRQPGGASGWKGPYLKKDVPNDPWGNPYTYRVPGTMGPYEIVSLGSDGREGGEGDGRDIYSWESR